MTNGVESLLLPTGCQRWEILQVHISHPPSTFLPSSLHLSPILPPPFSHSPSTFLPFSLHFSPLPFSFSPLSFPQPNPTHIRWFCRDESYSHQMIQRGGSMQKITSGLNAEQTLSASWFWLCAEGLSLSMLCRWPSDFTRSENQTVSGSKRSSVVSKLNLSGTAKHHCKWTITVSEPTANHV